ncbi:S26 family signal peptidase [Streptomyces violaceorubidus]
MESRDGTRVAVNDKEIDEPYVLRDKFAPTGPRYDVTVPEGLLFLLGGHRANANDSRYSLCEAPAATRPRPERRRPAPGGCHTLVTRVLVRHLARYGTRPPGDPEG